MRQAQEREFHSFDQVPLFYRYWAGTTATPATGHRAAAPRAQHSGRVTHLVDELDLPDTAFFAWDARGNGRSPGARGDAPGFPALVRDLDSFIAHIGAEHGIAVEDIVVIAQSVGAVVAATWVHDYAPRLRALVMASPAFKVKLYVPFARPGLALMQKLRGNFFVNSYVKPQWLTHDPARVESYRTDPLITRPISVRVLLGLYEAADRIVADAQAISVPVQLLVSGSDFVVHRGPQDRFYERLSSPIKERVHLPGFFHDTLGERDRAPALARIRSFIQARFAEPLRELSRRDAHRHGPTFEESEIPGLAARAQQPGRSSLARGARWPALWRQTVRRHCTGPADRFRFGQHAGLHLSRRSTWQRPVGSPGRPQLPGCDRGAASAFAVGTCRNCCAMPPSACVGRACRCACWTWPLAMAVMYWKRWARASNAPSASCCATSAV